jgi:hypothetical protein
VTTRYRIDFDFDVELPALGGCVTVCRVTDERG